MYFQYTSEFGDLNIEVLKVYFKYTSEFQNKHINIESLVQVYF